MGSQAAQGDETELSASGPEMNHRTAARARSPRRGRDVGPARAVFGSARAASPLDNGAARQKGGEDVWQL